jgi:hypothetical protein
MVRRIGSRMHYVNFGHPSVPIYRNLRYSTPDLRLKIEVLHTPMMHYPDLSQLQRVGWVNYRGHRTEFKSHIGCF